MNVVDTLTADPPLASGVAAVPPALLAEEYRRIVAAHEANGRLEKRRERGHTWTVGGLLLGNVALAGAVVLLLPLKQLVPVFVTLQGDGSYTTSIAQRDLSIGERDATIKAALWLYVRARLSYASGQHFEDQKIVYMLSDKRVGDAFQAEVSPKNAASPWRKFGTRTVIHLERISESFPCGYDSCVGRDPDAYQVRFRRIVQGDGQVHSQQWIATLRFRVVKDIPAWERVTYNPLGLQVTEWNVSEEGAAP